VKVVDIVEPPSDPNDWTDEQWLTWLKATDDVPSDAPDDAISTVVRRVVESGPGQALGQAMLGLSQAIYGRHDDDVAIVVEGSGEGTDDEPFAVRLDPNHPERSSVTFRSRSNPST
jgi:hypothetical protein